MKNIKFKIGDRVRIESGVYCGIHGTVAGFRADPNGLGENLFRIDSRHFPILAIEVLAEHMQLRGD
jgi:transcription antitermination factor NusG